MLKRKIPSPARRQSGDPGFSLVELMVALLFTGLLMVGMAQVFKSSLATFYTSGEILSSARRNRASIDLLYDDLNSAGLYLTDLAAPPIGFTATNPAFSITPNQPVAGAEAGDPGFAADPGFPGTSNADQLLFYLDQPLAFEGIYAPPALGAPRNADEAIGAGALLGGAPAASNADTTFTIDCGESAYANLVKVGQSLVFKDAFQVLSVASVTASGSKVTITTGATPNVAMTGIGNPGGVSKFKHISNSRVLFYNPAQVVRYSIKKMKLDPQNTKGIPCLVRDQGTFSTAGFVPDPTQEAIVTENVSGFKVYLSVNSGQTWAGFNSVTNKSQNYTTWANIRADVDTQLTGSAGPPAVPAAGRSGYQTTQGNETWFRKIPTLVRLDITTRTASKRTEYDPNQTALKYRDLVQSLVVVPRHFGLPLN